MPFLYSSTIVITLPIYHPFYNDNYISGLEPRIKPVLGNKNDFQ